LFTCVYVLLERIDFSRFWRSLRALQTTMQQVSPELNGYIPGVESAKYFGIIVGVPGEG
jgi:hypothetical protein